MAFISASGRSTGTISPMYNVPVGISLKQCTHQILCGSVHVNLNCMATCFVYCLQIPVEAKLLMPMMVDLQRMVSKNNNEY